MPKENIFEQLAGLDVYGYGSAEQLKLEKQMARYFEREYERWRGNENTPMDYGLNSYEGEISKRGSRDESTDHYNEEYQVYRAFLDKDYMAYTMGYFGATEEAPEITEQSLEQAQENKYELLIERADIQDGQTILDLGCGFGGFSKYLLKKFPNVAVTGINPCEVQAQHIRNELIGKDDDFGESRYRLIQAFCDDITSETIDDEYFDRVVSVGLLEHVTNIDLLQQIISRVLKKGGKCLHHCIVSYDTMPNYLNAEDSYMGHYYPGAHIWPYKEPTRHNTHLKFKQSWFVNGLNYWKTLDEWHKRFWESIEQLHPEFLSVEKAEDWNKYFTLCKAMFCPNDGKSYGNGQFLYEKI